MLEINEVYYGDCRDIMKEIADNTIDLTVTSPPYDKLRNYSNSLLWDATVWKGVIDKLYCITKPGGVVVWIVGDSTINGSETCSSFKQAIYFREKGFNLYDTMIFKKHGMPTDQRIRYFQRFEYIFVFCKGRPKTYNPICDVVSLGRKHIGGVDRIGDVLIKTKKAYTSPEYSCRGNIWEYDCRNMDSDHPAPFPYDLAKDCIISWSKKGDIVLDPFAGRGTTGKAARVLGRKFILIEKQVKYRRIINEYLCREQGDLFI